MCGINSTLSAGGGEANLSEGYGGSGSNSFCKSSILIPALSVYIESLLLTHDHRPSISTWNSAKSSEMKIPGLELNNLRHHEYTSQPRILESILLIGCATRGWHCTFATEMCLLLLKMNVVIVPNNDQSPHL